MSMSMEDQLSAENADHDGLASSIEDQTTNEKRPDEANSGDSTNEKESAKEQPPDESASSDSTGKPSSTTADESANGNPSTQSSSTDSTDEPVTTSTNESASDQKPLEPVSGGSTKNPAAVFLGRLGGLKGGKARAKTLSSKQRSDAARKAAKARWAKKKGTE
jgi:hypothetical protein